MFLVALTVLLVTSIAVRLLLTTSGVVGRGTRRLVNHLGRAWRRADWLGRATQLPAYLLLAVYLLTPSELGGGGWANGRSIALAGLAGATVAGGTALIARRVIHRIQRPREDERLWQTRELIYADAGREGYTVLYVDGQQYETDVGQRAWTVHAATGEVEDTWFAGQWFPTGSFVLADWTTHGARHGLSWLTSSQLSAASRHNERVQRQLSLNPPA